MECPDENTGGDEEEIEFRNVQARLLVENQLTPGYEILPLARDRAVFERPGPPAASIAHYVPPVLGVDAWGAAA